MRHFISLPREEKNNPFQRVHHEAAWSTWINAGEGWKITDEYYIHLKPPELSEQSYDKAEKLQ